MTREGKKRLEVWLPDNHPIFDMPKGARTAVVREWLNISSQLSVLEQRLTEIEKRLDGVKPLDDDRPTIDVRNYAKTIKDMFG